MGDGGTGLSLSLSVSLSLSLSLYPSPPHVSWCCPYIYLTNMTTQLVLSLYRSHIGDYTAVSS